MEQLAQEFAGSAAFFTVWVREAHAGGDYQQPDDMEDRERHASDFCAADGAAIPVILDDMQGSLHGQFGSFPNSVYVLDERGVVVYRANWADHREVRRVLEQLREMSRRFEQREFAGSPRWSEELLRELPDDPTAPIVTSFKVWQSARNYDEPERFFGQRSEQMRDLYRRATGEESIRAKE